jgi:hypothetical protein
VAHPVTAPAAPSIVSGFTVGTTDYYFCVAGDTNADTSNGLGLTPQSTSTGTTATTGTMSCPGVTGALKLYLLRAATPTLTNGAQSVQVAVCTTTSGVGCNMSDAANAPSSFFVQGTQGNGTAYMVAQSGIFVPLLSLQDGLDVFMPAGTSGNPLVNYLNGTVVSAINANGEFFSQPTDTSTVPFVGNAPSGTTASLIDLLVNGSHKFTVTSNGALLVGSLTSSVTGSPSISGANFTSATVPNASLVTAPLTAASTLDTTKLSSAAMPTGVTGSPTLDVTNFTGTLPALNGAALTSQKWIWLGGSNATMSTSAATFFTISGLSPAASSGTIGNVQETAGGVYSISNLNCTLMTSGGTITVAGGTNYVLAVQKNNSSQTLTCTIAAAASSCSDVTHSFTTAANDILNYVGTPSGTPTALEAKCSVQVNG